MTRFASKTLESHAFASKLLGEEPKAFAVDRIRTRHEAQLHARQLHQLEPAVVLIYKPTKKVYMD